MSDLDLLHSANYAEMRSTLLAAREVKRLRETARRNRRSLLASSVVTLGVYRYGLKPGKIAVLDISFAGKDEVIAYALLGAVFYFAFEFLRHALLDAIPAASLSR